MKRGLLSVSKTLAGAKGLKLSQNTPRQGQCEALSAGTMPSQEANRFVVQVMQEKDSDISGNKPKLLETRIVQEADKVIVMSCDARELCPSAVA